MSAQHESTQNGSSAWQQSYYSSKWGGLIGKKYLISFHFWQRTEEPEGSSECSPWDSNWKPRVLLPIQLSSSTAQGSSSVERKSIHQRVITGLISLLLQSPLIQRSGSLLSPVQPGINTHCCSLEYQEIARLWKLRIHWLRFVLILEEPIITEGFIQKHQWSAWAL